MKTFAERFPGKQPQRGYLARCASCGRVVVHAEKTNLPFSMHRKSKKCSDARKKKTNA
jgi:hypothetical protein